MARDFLKLTYKNCQLQNESLHFLAVFWSDSILHPKLCCLVLKALSNYHKFKLNRIGNRADQAAKAQLSSQERIS